jgi:TatD DNase family protein
VALQPGWIDNHCHLDDDRIDGGAAAAIARGRDHGVTGFITIGTDRARSLAAMSIAADHESVWCTIGLHPHDASASTESIADLLDPAQITARKIVAVGECGLDYHYDHSPRAQQRTVFAEQIALARALDLTLVIHTREAWADTFDILDGEGVPPRTVMHCFSGGPDEARACLDRGAYLSFSGVVTFKNAESLRDAARLCPPDRLLVETDSPYLTPVPLRGRPNEPQHVALVGAGVAAARNESIDLVQNHTFEAALVAFGLPRA